MDQNAQSWVCACEAWTSYVYVDTQWDSLDFAKGRHGKEPQDIPRMKRFGQEQWVEWLARAVVATQHTKGKLGWGRVVVVGHTGTLIFLVPTPKPAVARPGPSCHRSA
jgi:broad specificity phosphatase PhoE